jgi:hypothetical protein
MAISNNRNNRAYPPGIHAPTVTFFLPDGDRQEIDWATQDKHLEFLVKSGVHGSRHSTPFHPTFVCYLYLSLFFFWY